MATVFPVGGRSICERMYGRYPELVVNDDVKRRELVTYIGQQFAYTYGAQWGNKKRSGLSDDFRSADSIAVLEPDGTISVWDYQQGNAELTIIVNDGDQPTHPNLSTSEADFMRCDKVDHLGGTPPPDPEPPDDGHEAEQDALIQVLLEAVQALSIRVKELEVHTLKDSDTLKVQGKTASAAWHTHGVDLVVTR